MYAPVNGRSNSSDCALHALDASDGSELWRHDVPPADCAIHAVADPSVGDVVGDGADELVATTNDGAVKLVAPSDGSVIATCSRDVVVYTHAVTADVDGDGVEEIFVVYSDGTVVALSAA